MGDQHVVMTRGAVPNVPREPQINPHEAQPTPQIARKRHKNERDIAVRTYTVANESNHVVVFNVAAVGVVDELVRKFAAFGKITQHTMLDNHTSDQFTDSVWITFAEIQSARQAKRKLDDSSFYGHSLCVRYAPECESMEETLHKLNTRRLDVIKRIRNLSRQQQQPSGSHTPHHTTTTSRAHPHPILHVAAASASKCERSAHNPKFAVDRNARSQPDQTNHRVQQHATQASTQAPTQQQQQQQAHQIRQSPQSGHAHSHPSPRVHVQRDHAQVQQVQQPQRPAQRRRI